MNAFDHMDEQNRRFFDEGPGDEIRRNILGSLGTIRFLGNVADVYLNRMVETVVSLAGGGRGPQDRQDERTGSSQEFKNSGYPNL
ncbi:MAG: hypothetical protein D6772_09965 [Bacteroidetes bacterium]|nr:MAG: hypothetical protein D6772_09965 [Bacteroidota bacterium]